jgi:thioredoxin-dependent peroxiredoxin
MGRTSIAAFALAVAACSRQPPPSPAPPASASPEPVVVAPAQLEVAVGKPAPDFTGATYDGKTVGLASLRGKPVVLYFYPKDETAGCTKEACSFRDAWGDLAATHATLIGVSMDNAESHKEFVEHWKLPFILISDTDGSIAARYGVPLRSHGDASVEARQTFVIGPDGVIKKIYREVDVSKHAAEVLADLKP